MELSNEQLKMISSSSLIEDIKKYKEAHKQEYEEFIKKRKKVI